MFKHQTAWTKEDEDRLRQLAAQHLTGGQIVKALGGGRTRNAIIGKCHRLGLTLSSGETSGMGTQRAERLKTKALAARAIQAKQSVPKRLKQAPAPSSINPQRIPDFKPPTIIPDRSGTGPTVAELETGMCRAPVGQAGGADQQHCGGQTDPVPKGSRTGIAGFETYCPACKPRLSKAIPSRAR